MTGAETYNGTAGTADDGYSSGIRDLNVFYDVRTTSSSVTETERKES